MSYYGYVDRMHCKYYPFLGWDEYKQYKRSKNPNIISRMVDGILYEYDITGRKDKKKAKEEALEWLNNQE